MFKIRLNRRIGYVGGIVLAILLLLYLAYRCQPLSQKNMEESAVVVSQSSYYQIEVNGKPRIYFSDYSDSSFVGGSINKDSIYKRRVEQHGYWVNRFSIIPSCFGRIVIGWNHKPSRIVNLRDNHLRKLLFHSLIQMDAELGGLQTKRNELGYYLRVHSVQDYGYNKIADYHAMVVQQMDSLQRIMKVVHDMTLSTSHLQIRQINNYVIQPNANKKTISCNRLKIYKESQTVLLQTETGMTPFGISTRLTIPKAIDNLRKHHLLHPKSVGPEIEGIHLSSGIYKGETQKGIPNGYGKLFGSNGSFYDGHWKRGKRDGFGIYVAPNEYLQVGEWKNDIFKGERLTYTAERIYGIDLSRHQHEQNNKYYHIYWNKLRITDLGTLSSKTINGKVDYPISFAYVKSTEGCTILNAYYLTDYTEARRHGIRTGTYHFFSTTTPGAAQADYFLKHSKFNKHDLPPVLDVEPSDVQIAKMGGAKVMFRSIRAWLERVRQRTGRRPILYISQSFVNQYLPLAPDLTDNYLVWIARYGEYKPNVKLIYWQLSPDGKVRGIHGGVDINVFNGYRNQYEDFLKRHCF